MTPSFQRSLLYSTLFHALLLLALWAVYGRFLVVRTPLLMELTLIGRMAQGEGLGSTTAHSGQQSGQAPQVSTAGEFETPKKETAPPPLRPSLKAEAQVKRPMRTQKDPGTDRSEAHLKSLRRTAPIGLSSQDDPSAIKTNPGTGTLGSAGVPEGNPDIEGELAARNILRRVDPDYPEWAQRQGIEAVVKYRLTVLPSGLLRLDALQLDQTSGYRELDQEVYKALLQWEFEPLAAQVPQVDQSGVITFNFNFGPSR